MMRCREWTEHPSDVYYHVVASGSAIRSTLCLVYSVFPCKLLIYLALRWVRACTPDGPESPDTAARQGYGGDGLIAIRRAVMHVCHLQVASISTARRPQRPDNRKSHDNSSSSSSRGSATRRRRRRRRRPRRCRRATRPRRRASGRRGSRSCTRRRWRARWPASAGTTLPPATRPWRRARRARSRRCRRPWWRGWASCARCVCCPPGPRKLLPPYEAETDRQASTLPE